MPDSTSNSDLISQLERLAEIKKKGYLSDEEYGVIKAQVISQISEGNMVSDPQSVAARKSGYSDGMISENRSFSADDLI